MATSAKTLAGGKFKVAKSVTLTQIKLAKNRQYFFQMVEAMTRAKEVTITKKVFDEHGNEVTPEKRQPPMVAKVIDLETGELGQIVCPQVMVSELNDGYPGEAYVGKCFAVTLTKVDGKNYNLVEILEIEPNEAEVEAKGGESTAANDKPGKAKKAA